MKQKLILILNDQGGAFMDWNFKGIAGTLRAEMSSSHPGIVLLENEEDTDEEPKNN